MVKLKRFLNPFLPILPILILAFLLRIFWLERFPNGLSHDEIDFIASARTYWKFGQDSSGVKFPLSLFFTKTDARGGEVPPLLFSPFFGLLPLTLSTVKIPYVALGILTVAIIFFITLRLFKKKDLALWAMFSTAINPWGIFVGRTAFDAPVGNFFYLLGFLTLLYCHSWKIFYSFPLFILAFFSYQGAKITFIPLLLLFLGFHYFSSGKLKILPYVSFMGVALLFFTLYTATVFKLPEGGLGERKKEIIFFNQEQLAKETDIERRTAITTKIAPLFSNKLTLTFKKIIGNFYGAFSSHFLFVRGDLRATYAFLDHGFFYYLDGIFLVLGLVGVYLLDRRLWFMLIFSLVVAVFSSLINLIEQQYIFRSALMFPLLAIFIGGGIFTVINLAGKKGKIAFLIIIFLYSLSLLNFLYFAFFRYPILADDAFFQSERRASKYVLETERIAPEKKITVISDLPRSTFWEYMFFSGNINNDKILEEGIRMTEGSAYRVGNIEFRSKCPEEKEINEGIIFLVHQQRGCQIERENELTIISPKDAGEIFRIYNDALCSNSSVERYPRFIYLKDLDIEKMDVPDFCRKWIGRIR